MEEIINQLLVVSEGLLLLWFSWFIWFISGVANNLFSSKKWSWKRMGEDVLKTFLMTFGILAWVTVFTLFDHYTSNLGVDMSKFLDGVSITGLIVIICGGTGLYLCKGFRNFGVFIFKDHTDMEEVLDKIVAPEKITAEQFASAAEPIKQVVNDVYQFMVQPKESIEAHKEWEERGGLGASYVVPYNTYDAFRTSVMGRGYNIDGAYGAQCLTAGHLVAMADGSYVAIEDLQEGEIVLGGNKVLSNQPQESDVMTVHTSLGKFTCTLDHKCVLKDGSIKLARDLNVGDIIKTEVKEPEKRYDLTDDECRWLGFWLGDGTKKARWTKTTKPQCFITVGTAAKEYYLETLDIAQHTTTHSNGRAKIYSLINREHPELLRCLAEMPGRALPRLFTAEQYRYIIEGYIMADGTPKNSGYSVTSMNKELLVSIQFGAMLNNSRAVLSGPYHREYTNLCDHPQDYYRLTINTAYAPVATVKRVEYHDEIETVYILNLDGNHLYQADNLYHHNCWDGAGLLWQQLGMWLQTGNGCAYGCWTLKKDANLGTRFEAISDKSQVKRGDVVVFRAGEYGHIAFADEDYNGSGVLKILGQNQGGTPYVGGGSNFNVISMNMATFLGAFRFKDWSTTSHTTQSDTDNSNYDFAPEPGQAKKGDYVEVKRFVDAYGTKLASLQSSYKVIEADSMYAVLQTNDGAIYARMKQSDIQVVNSNSPSIVQKETEQRQQQESSFWEGEQVKFIGTTDYDGRVLNYRDRTYTISQIRGDRVVLTYNGKVWAAVKLSEIVKV